MKIQHRQHLKRWVLVAFVVVSAIDRAKTFGSDAVVHWINSAAQNGVTVLSSGNVFTTDFKGANDVQISLLSGSISSLFLENFGGATPGNNPSWVTSFIGNTVQGTGDGIAGNWQMLLPPTSGVVLQFDFAIPLTPADRMMIADVDNTETHRIEAFTRVGNTFTPVSVSGWTHQAFSGQSGITPDARWATWNGVDGTLNGSGNSLNEPLDVLIPNQSVDRVVFTKFSGGSGTPALQFSSPSSSGLPGDYNSNGVVDAPDYVVWRNGLGSTFVPADYDVWRTHFGQTAASGSEASPRAAVPEPASVGLVVAAITGLILRSRRR
jgi:hypothetical protein